MTTTHLTREEIVGRVEAFIEDVAVVTLLNKKTNELIEAECPIATLLDAGIAEGDEFVCEILKENGKTTVQFRRLEPKQLSPERIAAILKEVDCCQ